MIRFDSLPPEVIQAMCTPMHQVIPRRNSTNTGGLYIGSLSALHEPDMLRREGVTHLVQVLDVGWLPETGQPGHQMPQQDYSTPRSFFPPQQPVASSIGTASGSITTTNGLVCYRLDLSDSPSSSHMLLASLESTCAFIRASLASNKSVLVHCQQGISRSAAVVIAYLIKEEGMGFDEALRWTKEKRACVKPNSGFVKVLREWESYWRNKRERVHERPVIGRRFTS
ncbi:protein-tyrosine phosphatase-like protein [Mycena floridula]|nr:protein-tyrosine phosphatase-like protein [Mycena floridula]